MKDFLEEIVKDYGRSIDFCVHTGMDTSCVLWSDYFTFKKYEGIDKDADKKREALIEPKEVVLKDKTVYLFGNVRLYRARFGATLYYLRVLLARVKNTKARKAFDVFFDERSIFYKIYESLEDNDPLKMYINLLIAIAEKDDVDEHLVEMVLKALEVKRDLFGRVINVVNVSPDDLKRINRFLFIDLPSVLSVTGECSRDGCEFDDNLRFLFSKLLKFSRILNDQSKELLYSGRGAFKMGEIRIGIGVEPKVRLAGITGSRTIEFSRVLMAGVVFVPLARKGVVVESPEIIAKDVEERLKRYVEENREKVVAELGI